MRLLIMVLLLPLVFITETRAASWETLIMPGKVISGHAKIEDECSSCHNRFDKSAQTGLCLDCHKKINADLMDKQGYHGRHPGIGKQACKSCHTDHQGRAADIVALNTEVFDHRLTDFVLKGAHTGSSCTQCHQPDKPYRDTAGECIACHKKQDVHQGKLGRECQDCHTPKQWQETRFDHNETDFKLRGSHETTACNSCHLQADYKKTPTECIACHRSNDAHQGRNGEDCSQCHTSKAWDESRFDHNRDTDFRLLGLHREVHCESCHQNDIGKDKLATDCYSCHKNHDQHQGRFGRKCSSCHQDTGWDKLRFDHERNTDFPLRGKHRDLTCLACHRGHVKDDPAPTDCIGCHGSDDVHEGQQGKACARCHNEDSWSKKVRFDHDLTAFPLIGQHAGAPCEECHLSAQFKDAEKTCIDCHKADDQHQQTLGEQCALCHTPNAWSLWRFDHSQQTDFALTGAHENLACDGCHRSLLSEHARISSRCDACHQQDDIHHGGFGHQCERCHSTESFSDVRIAQ